MHYTSKSAMFSFGAVFDCIRDIPRSILYNMRGLENMYNEKKITYFIKVS